MCGIVGYVGQRPALELLLGGLERLEYRGYDSAGVALLGGDGTAVRVRSVGGIAQLRDAVGRHPNAAALRGSTTGIGHTRWATHGRVSEGNAHPLTDDGQRVQIVLNREPAIAPGDLVLGITQSGVTADTIGALAMARSRGANVLALTNVAGSQVTREAAAVLLTDAGTEVGVAATKTFVTQVALLAVLARRLGTARGVLADAQAERLDEQLQRLPAVAAAARAASEQPIARAAERWSGEPFFLFLGRHAGLPVALEGALKLKEISYIPSDAYAAGEMKHGPIALLSEGTPVVVVATQSPVLNKLRSNVSEVRARGAHVLAIATEGAAGAVADEADELVLVPGTDPLLSPIPAIVPLQLLAHAIACARGLDPDRPRNLAKTVTVE